MQLTTSSPRIWSLHTSRRVFDGINGTLVVYGPSGCGKTHTLMEGEGDVDGLIQLAAAEIDRLKESNQQREYTVKCSSIQCYMEEVHDLLSYHPIDPKTKKENLINLAIRNKTIKDIIFSRPVIKNEEDVRKLLKDGNGRRKICNNGVNNTSSRSNVIYQFFIESAPKGGATAAEPAKTATLTFSN